MPNKRAKGQKLIGFPVDEDLLAALDREARTSSRSAVLREAVFDYLVAKGHSLDEEKKLAPPRTGKGGPKKKVTYNEPKKTSRRKQA